MNKATYIGPIEHLKGKTALIRAATHGHVIAQFDDHALSKSGAAIAHGPYRCDSDDCMVF